MEGDVYSDTPHLYGNALSSVNVLRVGEKATDGLKEGDAEDEVLEEGGDGEGVEWRKQRDVPETGDARKKHFLTHGKTGEWEWEEGRVYKADFFNPYLDFNGGFGSCFELGGVGVCKTAFADTKRLTRIRVEATRLQPLDTALSGRRGLSEVYYTSASSLHHRVLLADTRSDTYSKTKTRTRFSSW